MWPDFDGADLDDALNEFRRRERRFGGLPAIALSQTVLPNGHLDALTSH
jgi:undecaprenyl diphosphate synthase